MTNKAVITWKDKDVHLDGRQLISMPDNVVKALAIDDKIVILTIQGYETHGSMTVIRGPQSHDIVRQHNIVAVDHQGQFVWRVQIPDAPVSSYYTNIWLHDGQLHGYHYSGWDITLDHKSGEILQKVPMK